MNKLKLCAIQSGPFTTDEVLSMIFQRLQTAQIHESFSDYCENISAFQLSLSWISCVGLNKLEKSQIYTVTLLILIPSGRKWVSYSTQLQGFAWIKHYLNSYFDMPLTRHLQNAQQSWLSKAKLCWTNKSMEAGTKTGLTENQGLRIHMNY